MGTGSSVDRASGGVGGVLVSFYYRGKRVLGQLLPNNTSMVSLNKLLFKLVKISKIE